MFIPFFQIFKYLRQFFKYLKKHTYKSQNTFFILIIILKGTIYIKTIIQIILIKNHHNHKVKYIITVCIPIIIIKNFFLLIKKICNYIKKNFSSPYNYKKKVFLLNIRMVNQGLYLSLNEYRLIAEHRNMKINLQKI